MGSLVLNTTEEGISEFGEMPIETSKTENQREKNEKNRKEQKSKYCATTTKG